MRNSTLMDGPQGQKRTYLVGELQGYQRVHPGNGFVTCTLYRKGLCNNYSVYADNFRHCDPFSVHETQ